MIIFPSASPSLKAYGRVLEEARFCLISGGYVCSHPCVGCSFLSQDYVKPYKHVACTEKSETLKKTNPLVSGINKKLDFTELATGMWDGTRREDEQKRSRETRPTLGLTMAPTLYVAAGVSVWL